MWLFTHFSVSIYYLYALFFIKPKNLWIKNLLAEIFHFNTQKYKNLFSQN